MQYKFFYSNPEGAMYIVEVYVQVKPEFVNAFRNAVLDNARNSAQEPGVARFDVLQESEDYSRFALIEVYRTPEDALKHKETTHYARWRDVVEEMMVKPRSSVKYNNVFPGDSGW
jgi:autoinducer 2-degrading protein